MSRPVIGIVGGGQLARMTAQAAISLAVETRVLAADPKDSARFVADQTSIGDPGVYEVLERFSRGCDVLTFDHERVDPDVIGELELAGCVIRPDSTALRFADKAYQRERLARAGYPVPAFAVASTATEIDAFALQHGWPVVAKTATGGYDGRGVFVLDGPPAAMSLIEVLAGRRLIIEPMLVIDREIAIVVARRPGGETAAYPAVETVQRDGICVETITPATVEGSVAAAATALAVRIADTVGAVGILAVELFLTRSGLLINELAPRPHNSGHWTIEGAVTSQFENHIRGILDWPLGDTELTAPAVAMVNVLGDADHVDPSDRLPSALRVKGAGIHLYAKEPRLGRKLGHVTALGPDPAAALSRARLAAATLASPTHPTENRGATR